jgi:hypothetical protein
LVLQLSRVCNQACEELEEFNNIKNKTDEKKENKTIFSMTMPFSKVIRNRIYSSHTDFIVETYATGELCLANLDKKPDVIILTTIWTELIKCNEWIETLDKIKEFDPDIPVVMLSLRIKLM